MTIKTDLQDRIAAINAKAVADKAAIDADAAAQVAELQAVLDQNEGWLLRDTKAFKAKVDRVVSLVMMKP